MYEQEKITIKKFLSLLVLLGTLITICFFPLLVQAEASQLRTSITDFMNGRRIPGNTRITFIPHSDFGTTTISHMNEALWEWNHNLPSGIEGVYRDPVVRHSTENYPSWDYESRIYRKDLGWDEYVAEITLIPPQNSVIVTEADININMHHNWVNSAQPNAYDVWTVFLHEAGHLYGLCDVYDSIYSNRVMYGIASTNSTKRSLASAEVHVLQNIYS